MADVMDAYLRGVAAAEAQQQHQQALQTSKLRQQILAHHIKGLQIEDQLRAREVAQQHSDRLSGRPEGEIPSEQVPTSTPLAGGVQNLLGGQVGSVPGQGQTTV